MFQGIAPLLHVIYDFICYHSGSYISMNDKRSAAFDILHSLTTYAASKAFPLRGRGTAQRWMRCLFVLTFYLRTNAIYHFRTTSPDDFERRRRERAMRYVDHGGMGTPHPAPDVATFPSRGRLSEAACVCALSRCLYAARRLPFIKV